MSGSGYSNQLHKAPETCPGCSRREEISPSPVVILSEVKESARRSRLTTKLQSHPLYPIRPPLVIASRSTQQDCCPMKSMNSHRSSFKDFVKAIHIIFVLARFLPKQPHRPLTTRCHNIDSGGHEIASPMTARKDETSSSSFKGILVEAIRPRPK